MLTYTARVRWQARWCSRDQEKAPVRITSTSWQSRRETEIDLVTYYGTTSALCSAVAMLEIRKLLNIIDLSSMSLVFSCHV